MLRPLIPSILANVSNREQIVMANAPHRIMQLAVFSIALQFAVPAPADVEAGKRAYQAADYATAFSEFRWDASQGNPAALTGIAVMYEKGLGVTSDPYTDRKSTRLNSSHIQKSRMPSSA